jgi:hypothetical protein
MPVFLSITLKRFIPLGTTKNFCNSSARSISFHSLL